MKTKAFYFLVSSTLIFFTLSTPVEGMGYAILVSLFLFLNLFLGHWLAGTGLIQHGYKGINHWIVKLFLIAYYIGMYKFVRAWLENIQHSLWDIIYDNLTDIAAILYLVLHAIILGGSLVLYHRYQTKKPAEAPR